MNDETESSDRDLIVYDFLDDEDESGKVGTKFKTRKFILITFGIAAFIAVSVGAFYLGSHFKGTPSVGQSIQVNGTTGSTTFAGAMSEQELRSAVQASHLTVYWVGPVANYKYSLFIPKTGVTVVKYLPAGNGLNDTAPNYRVIGTYVQVDATTAVVTSGKKTGSVGFTNADGNAVFYVRSRPTNVYVAIKDKGVQIEIFDPVQDQSLALALFKGQIQQIK
jgi:hypothetical protein